MMNQVQLAIFDMDGTLFDTSEVNYHAYAAAAEKRGFALEKESFLKIFVGKNYKEFLPLLGICGEADLEFIHLEKKRQYPAFLKYAKKNQHLFELLFALKNTCRIALATTASKKNTMDILHYFNAEKLFDYIVAQEDIRKLKPDPECYIEVMRLSGVKPEHTIIFEDSEVGIAAGCASGAMVYKVCNF